MQKPELPKFNSFRTNASSITPIHPPESCRSSSQQLTQIPPNKTVIIASETESDCSVCSPPKLRKRNKRKLTLLPDQIIQNVHETEIRLPQDKCIIKICDGPREIHCIFCSFHRYHLELLEIRRSLIISAGLGLFTTYDIPIGQPVQGLIFIGELITAAEASTRDGGYLLQITTHHYLDSFSPRTTNHCKYINDHKDSGLLPNVRIKAFKFGDDSRQFLFYATRDIKKGEELLMNYGEKYWKQQTELSPNYVNEDHYVITIKNKK